jgi:hypothetical protein
MEKSSGVCNHIIDSDAMIPLKSTCLLLLVVGGVACAPRQPAAGPAPTGTSPAAATAPGAATSRAALETFLRAVHREDLQAMSLIWGTVDGAARDRMSREDLERRELIMICFLRHDNYQILGEQQLAGSERRTAVELRRGNLTRSSNFTTIQARDGRWYVLTADLEPLRDFCSNR